MLCCVVIPFILDVGVVDVPAGSHRRKATQDFSSTFLLRCLPYFFSRRIQPFLSLGDCEVEFHVLTI